MPSTYTGSLGLELQANGENNSAWGTKANTVFSLLEEATSGYVSVAIAGSTALTITDGTASSGATDQARKAFIKLTGTPGAGFTLTLPEVEKSWVLWNATDGAATIQTGTATATVVLPVGQMVLVQSDGAGSVLQVTPFFTSDGEIPVGQIENVGATTISATQWGYVGEADQSVKTADSPTFAGLTATTADINGGTIDGAAIGGTTAAAGTFTALTATTSATLAGLSYPTADGGNGQFIKTDGAGNLAFGTPAGGGDMLASANLSDLASAPAALTNLGLSATATELNYVSGVTSPIQTQLDSISVTQGSLTKSFTAGESVNMTLSNSTAPAPIVAVTKEVPQVGAVSKGAWDVATSGDNYDRIDYAYDTTLTPVAEGFDVSTSVFSQSFSVGTQDTTPQDVFFKPDGTKMYVIGQAGDNVYEYDLSTAWDVSTASFLQSFSITAQETAPRGIFFKPDGLKMYVLGYTGQAINEYNLSTAWDISSAVFSQLFSVSAQETSPTGFFFKTDGLKMYVVGGGDNVYEYNLSAAWDVSSAVFSQLFSVAAQDTTPANIFFKPDGTKMYVTGQVGQDINEYNLSTAWDITTAVFSQLFSVVAQDTAPRGIFFKPDGTKMYVVGGVGQDINEYDLTLFDKLILGTGSFAAGDIGMQIEGNGGKAVLTATDGSYVLETAFNDTSTIPSGSWNMFALDFDATKGLVPAGFSTAFDISTASFLQSFSVAAQETTPQGIFFKPDGLKMYVVGQAGDNVNEYNLSTAWDISTASFLQNFSVAAQETIPTGIFFKPDGLKMYVTGAAGQDVNEYNLSTAWDVSTAIFSQLFSVAVQDAAPRGIFFKTDGLKMYVVGSTGDSAYEYNLSTAWNVSTASFLQNFSVAAQDTVPTGIFFKTDGLKMYVVGYGADSVYEYDLSTAWDISTAVFSQLFSVSAQDTVPFGLFFKPDGLKMYVVGYGADSVYEYDVGEVYASTGYNTAITNAGGQIDSTYWTDLNAMTADQITGAGDVYYAVSTDGRTNWKVIDDTLGERSIVRDNLGTWEYNSAVDTVGYELGSAVYDGVSFSVAAQDTVPQGIFFKPDGTKMYVTGGIGQDVNEYNLSTAWDITTASFLQNFSVNAQETQPQDVFFKPDGTKMYVIGITGDNVYEYNLSTAWDVSSAVFSQLFSVAAQESNPHGIFFKPDGTKMYVIGVTGDNVYEYNLSTAWDVSTASFLQSFSVSAQEINSTDVFFKPDGTKMYVIGITGDNVYEYNLSTAWDISTAVFSQLFSVAAQDTAPQGIFFKPDGLKMYVIGYTGDSVYQYSTSVDSYTTAETWVPATTNQELYALDEALAQVSINRMDKTQLEAVTDPNHYVLGNSLDLMIGMYLPAATSLVPSSDGISINYDAAALNKGAILGTDYDFDYPEDTVVRITSNATQNLKVRIA